MYTENEAVHASEVILKGKFARYGHHVRTRRGFENGIIAADGGLEVGACADRG